MKSMSYIIAAVVCALVLCWQCVGCTAHLPPPTVQTPSDPDTEVAENTETETDEDIYHETRPSSSVPTVHIHTVDGEPITSKTVYKTATLSITEAESVADNITVETQIRGRGHSSFSGTAPQDEYDSKNSYRIKLDQKKNLLGVGQTADKDWVLIAGKYDISAMRNYTVWDLAKRMGTIPYVPSCAWVNVYINGDYRGLYTLVEKITRKNILKL